MRSLKLSSNVLKCNKMVHSVHSPVWWLFLAFLGHLEVIQTRSVVQRELLFYFSLKDEVNVGDLERTGSNSSQFQLQFLSRNLSNLDLSSRFHFPDKLPTYSNLTWHFPLILIAINRKFGGPFSNLTTRGRICGATDSMVVGNFKSSGEGRAQARPPKLR